MYKIQPQIVDKNIVKLMGIYASTWKTVHNSHLKTDNTTKTSHLPLGKFMFRMTWQARIIDVHHLPIIRQYY